MSGKQSESTVPPFSDLRKSLPLHSINEALKPDQHSDTAALFLDDCGILPANVQTSADLTGIVVTPSRPSREEEEACDEYFHTRAETPDDDPVCQAEEWQTF